MLTIYGIPNCDTMKKAMAWLNSNKLAYSFHDYKKEGISKAKLEAWCKLAGWEVLLNKKSTTWRELDPAEQVKITTQTAAIRLMMNLPASLKDQCWSTRMAYWSALKKLSIIHWDVCKIVAGGWGHWPGRGL